MPARLEINDDLRNLSPFTPTVTYTVYFINQETLPSTMSMLINLAQHHKLFTIATADDFSSNNAPTSIQIQFIQPHSIVILVEMLHLPDPSNHLFHRIRELFSYIFQSSNIIQGWGNAINKLPLLINDGLFTSDHLVQIRFVNIQKVFKSWYNDRYVHHDECPRSFYDDKDHPFCTCAHRPYKNPNDKWSLHMAIVKTFNLFLNQRLSSSPRSLGLDWALNCLAITELSMASSDGDYSQFLEHFISKPFRHPV